MLALDPGKEIADSPFATEVAAHLVAGNTLWWTQGSEQIEPALVLAQGLPAPRSFAALLSGRWSDFGWRDKHVSGLAADATTEGGTL